MSLQACTTLQLLRRLLPPLLILMAHSRLAGAATTTQVVYSDAPTFSGGELDHVAIGQDGVLTVAPNYTAVTPLDAEIVWDLALDANGTLYAATGNDGKVFMTPAGGATKLLVDLDELHVTALAITSDGALLAATSPDGRIYRIEAGKTPTVLVDPAPRYIWDIKLVNDRSLLVATGDPGGVFVVQLETAKKSEALEATSVLTTAEPHILTLSAGAKGRYYAGSAGHGYLYQFQLQKPQAVQVLLDAPGDEVKQVLEQSNGDLIALTSGPDDVEDEEFELAGFLGAEEEEESDERRTRIYRIRNEQPPEELWSASGVNAYSLAEFQGKVLVGLGKDGKILQIDAADQARLIADCSGKQVTRLVKGPRGSIFAGVSHPAAIFRLDDQLSEQGTWLSDVIDAGLFGYWGRIDVKMGLHAALKNATSGAVTIHTRSGNTGEPDATWNDFVSLQDQIQSPSARYLQFRLTLQSAKGVGPEVRAITLYYHPTNRPPQIDSIEVQDPDIRLDRKEEFVGDPKPRGINQPKEELDAPEIKPFADAGMQSIRWEASDPDGDRLTFNASLRQIQSESWVEIGSQLEQAFISFNSGAHADGWYQVRIQANDALSNDAGSTRSVEKISAPFPVDHMAPAIERSRAKITDGKAEIELVANDATTRLTAAEVSIDGGRFHPILPDDRVFDEQSERFSYISPKLASGKHHLVIRVKDGVFNVAAHKLELEIP